MEIAGANDRYCNLQGRVKVKPSKSPPRPSLVPCEGSRWGARPQFDVADRASVTFTLNGDVLSFFFSPSTNNKKEVIVKDDQFKYTTTPDLLHCENTLTPSINPPTTSTHCIRSVCSSDHYTQQCLTRLRGTRERRCCVRRLQTRARLPLKMCSKSRSLAC